MGRYVDGLVGALDAADADLAVVCQRSDVDHYGHLAPSAQVVAAPVAVAHRPARLAWEQTGLPLVANGVGAQVVHSPHYTLPLRAGRPVVVTVHDVTFFTEPAVHTSVKGTFFRSATRTALRRGARVVVPSAATRSELVRVLDADPGRIDVALHGVDPGVFHEPADSERQRVQGRLGLAGIPYIAFLGTLEPRKNVPALVRAWVAACEGRERPPALVLAGGAGWDDDVALAVAAVPETLRLVRPGYLGGAAVLAYPSLGEGFGLPVLEAMSCGAPVLTTRRLSLPEVGGEAVAYCEPDEAGITAGLVELLDDPQRREALGRAGHERARGFTWAASAQAHLESYARAIVP